VFADDRREGTERGSAAAICPQQHGADIASSPEPGEARSRD